MRTRTSLVLTRILVLVVAVSFIFTSCDNNGGGGSGSFTYDGTTYPLTKALIETYGANTGLCESCFDIDFSASTTGIDLVNFTGIGDAVYLD
jgi:hypothetical protein